MRLPFSEKKKLSTVRCRSIANKRDDEIYRVKRYL